MADRVGTDGSPSAPIVLIGEAPDHYAHVYSKPFVGPSYTDRLLPWWNDVGLARADFYITNVLDADPIVMGYHGHGPMDPAINAVPENIMRAAFDRLHERIAALPDPGPMVIVPTGNYALYALTGKGRVSFHARDGKWARPGIQALRGSILEYEDRRGRRFKVIPTVHPGATMPFRVPGLEWVCKADWARIAADRHFRELRLPQRTHLIMPSRGEVIEWLRWTRATAKEWASRPGARMHAINGRLGCSLDVETPNKVEHEIRQKESVAETAKCTACGHTKRWHTPLTLIGDFSAEQKAVATMCGKKGLKKDGAKPCDCLAFIAPLGKPRRVKVAEYPYLDCVGYSWNPAISLTVPTTLAYWGDDWPAIFAELAAFHADPNVDLFGQNFGFDAWWCAEESMPLHHIGWDLMKLHRVRVPYSEWHDLAFQSSLYTREPYWKDEAKDPDSASRYTSNLAAFHTYNGKDNCVQRELLPLHLEALRALGRLDYFVEMEGPLDTPLVELSRTGIRGDEAGRAAEYTRCRAEMAQVADEIERVAGVRLVAKTAVSAEKMKAFLYDQLRLPPQYTKNAKGGKSVSVNVVTIKRLMERFPGCEPLRQVGPLVLKHRRLNTVANNVKAERLKNGRQYAIFKDDTRLGRLKSHKTPKREGANLQNVDRKLRKFYLPDKVESAA